MEFVLESSGGAEVSGMMATKGLLFIMEVLNGLLSDALRDLPKELPLKEFFMDPKLADLCLVKTKSLLFMHG
jgi:hypothetical protein